MSAMMSKPPDEVSINWDESPPSMRCAAGEGRVRWASYNGHARQLKWPLGQLQSMGNRHQRQSECSLSQVQPLIWKN